MNSGSEEQVRIRLLEVQSWLTEYETLQNERANSQRQRGILVQINIIALGIIIGLVVTAKIYPFALLLTLSLLCSCLGLLWVHESRRSLACSRYIINKIAPALRELTGDQKILGAESYKYGDSYEAEKVLGSFLDKSVSPEGSKNPPREGKIPHQPLSKRFWGRTAGNGTTAFSRGGVTEFLFFLTPSIAGILIAVYGIISPERWYWYGWLLLVLAAILTIALATMGWRWYKEWYVQSPPQEELALEQKSRVDSKLK